MQQAHAQLQTQVAHQDFLKAHGTYSHKEVFE